MITANETPKLVKLVVAWCGLNEFHDSPYREPKPSCPNNGTWNYCT